VDRLAALGNALVPQIAEWIGRRILEYERATESRRGAVS
jgi:site-specific DNA-cytosine methylase